MKLFLLHTLLMSLPAAALTPEELAVRLKEVEAHRQLRIQATAPQPSDTDVRKAAGGAVVTGILDNTNGTRAYGLAVVPMGISSFWAALNDETRHPGFTAVGYSELVSGRACGSGRQVLQFLPVPMLADRWWIGILTKNAKLSQATGGSLRELAWQSSVDVTKITTESGKKIVAAAEPIGYSRGAWFLVAVNERTTWLEYFLHTDPGGNVPSGMASMFVTKGVRENIAAIQRFAKEARPACPLE